MDNIVVKMRDSTPLATDIYLPSKNGRPLEGRLPTVLERTPYDKENPTRRKEVGEWFASRGYAVVIQDFRGRFKSDGESYKYANMGEDSYDTTEWIARQPWSNGRIGTIGTSFMAHSQLALACMNPPHLTTMVVNQGGFTNAYLSSCRHMGAFELRQLTWAFNSAANSREAQADPAIRAVLETVNVPDYLEPGRGPLKKGESPLSLIPNYERFYLDMLTEALNTDYWRKVGLCAENYIDRIPDIPILLLGAWYDSYTRTTSDLFRGLSRIKKGPVKLIFGPWTHGWRSLETTASGEVELGPDAHIRGTGLAPTSNDLALRWFDRWMKGVDNGTDEFPPVNYFMMGGGSGSKTPEGKMSHGGEWRTSPDWPLPKTRYTKYYLHREGGLSASPSESGTHNSIYTYDPRNPVPTIGGNISSAHGVMMPGAFDQVERYDVFGCKPPYIPLTNRGDVLTFETPPLKDPIEVTGPITAVFYISSSAPDTDITMKLVDHYPPSPDFPDGFAMNISDTIFRGRFHSSWKEPELLEPETVYCLNLVSYPTSNLFKKGHQIRVDVSSSNYPRFDLNPNTGEPLGMSTRMREAVNVIHHDAEHPSCVVLPVIPT
jgi:putative CocE/NonD family hydrolase